MYSMNSAFILLFVVLSPLLRAHPGTGIVTDSKGNLYYTDLLHVWKIAGNGNKTIAVHNVHTHELFIDKNDDLFGEHLWYNGERADTWGHFVWCLRSNGILDTIIKPTAGFLENYSFVRDSQGNMYWTQRSKISRIKRFHQVVQFLLLQKENLKTSGGCIQPRMESYISSILLICIK